MICRDGGLVGRPRRGFAIRRYSVNHARTIAYKEISGFIKCKPGGNPKIFCERRCFLEIINAVHDPSQATCDKKISGAVKSNSCRISNVTRKAIKFAIRRNSKYRNRHFLAPGARSGNKE